MRGLNFLCGDGRARLLAATECPLLLSRTPGFEEGKSGDSTWSEGSPEDRHGEAGGRLEPGWGVSDNARMRIGSGSFFFLFPADH